MAANAGFAPVDRVSPPSNRTVAPGLVVREMPEPSPSPPSVMDPLKSLVPPVVLLTVTSAPRSSVIEPS